MKVYLASTCSKKYIKETCQQSKYCLESFHYFSPWQTILISNDFMLDSGAYTFMAASKQHKIDWDDYVVKYADFINKHDIKLFFELDIDSIVGIREVERLRNKLETLTKKKCIPVWHKSRGKQYFLDMVKHYNYVAIGGIVTKEIKRKEYPIFKWFINTAHQHNCKIHGLGFTNTKELRKYKFDSVDSSSWNSGGRYGTIYRFEKNTIKAHSSPKGKRLSIYHREIDKYNLIEWIKFQRYAEKSL